MTIKTDFSILNAETPSSEIYERMLPFVNKPSRYIGSEWNSLGKPEAFRKSAVGVCLCFPDLYETGFANTGIEILYQVVNRRDDAYAERAYAADSDLAKLLRDQEAPLFSLESRAPLASFDVVGFGLPYELCFTNILEMMDLARIPLRSARRGAEFPLIIGGGPCAVNPEPLADFFDAVVIGDGEDAIGDIIEAVKKDKRAGKNRERLLLELAAIPGVYVPALYQVRYNPDGTVAAVTPKREGVPAKVPYRRTSLDTKIQGTDFSFPIAPVVPFVQTVHDRLNVEIQRGCPWRCRFCQAGFSYRPYRERSKDDLLQIVEEGLKNTGYDAVTLAGLSAADHTEIVPLLQALSERLTARRVSVGLPSTRADRFTLAVAEILNTVRRQSITFAPEAGSERMRRVIRKELQETEIRETLKVAYQHGWKNVKLYFMYGLPTEVQEDLNGIVDLIRACKKEVPGLSFVLTLSPFVPKPHTPYQWHPQDRIDVLYKKLDDLRARLPAQIRAHGLEQIVVEGVLSRGDRRCGDLLEAVWKMGGKFDEWGERFRFDLWKQAMDATGISPEFYCHRERTEGEVLPWDHLQGGPEKRALWNDYQTALRQSKEPVPVDPHLKERPLVPAPKAVGLATAERAVQRLRFRMSRRGTVRFLSHLEQIEMLRRALRRTEFPVAYTSGFHPQIKCAFGPAVSVGYESDCEYFDLEVTRRVEVDQAHGLMAAQLPAGFSLLKTSRIPLFFPSLESLLNRVDYSVGVEADLLGNMDAGSIPERLKEFLDRDDLELKKTKKDKYGRDMTVRIPLKPMILEMQWFPAEPGSDRKNLAGRFDLALKFGPGKNVKPEKVVGLLLNLTEEATRVLYVRRRAFFIEKPDGALVEP